MNVSPQVDPNDLQDAIRTALKHRDSERAAVRPLTDLQIVQAAQQTTGTVHEAIDQVLSQALDRLARASPQSAQLLRMRWHEGMTVQAVATRLSVGTSTVYPMQRRALEELAEVVQTMEQEARMSHHARVAKRLGPPSYSQLLGVEPALAQLRQVVQASTDPWIVAIVGMGGIGKTSLADALVRRIGAASPFADFGWVSAQRSALTLGAQVEQFDNPALTVDQLVERLLAQLLDDSLAQAALTPDAARATLQGRLKAQPHLIVIDNLETFQDMEALLPFLRQLRDPTTFVLTSRESLHDEPDVWHFQVPALTEADALHLVRQEAQQRNLAHLLEATDAALRPIYETVGGNPLALRLVVGQTHVHALSDVLDDLVVARGSKAEQLYDYIYRRAWDHLDEPARQMWLATPLLPPSGGDAEFLSAISGLPPVVLRDALDTLVRQNLVDVRGPLDERRYAIHPLTRTFLHEAIAHWA